MRAPNLKDAANRVTVVSHYEVPSPCIYVMPATIARPRNNPSPVAQTIDEVHLLKAFHDCFGGRAEEVNYVDFDVEYRELSVAVRKRELRCDVPP